MNSELEEQDSEITEEALEIVREVLTALDSDKPHVKRILEIKDTDKFREAVMQELNKRY
jgi:hypothetical protein